MFSVILSEQIQPNYLIKFIFQTWKTNYKNQNGSNDLMHSQKNCQKISIQFKSLK